MWLLIDQTSYLDVLTLNSRSVYMKNWYWKYIFLPFYTEPWHNWTITAVGSFPKTFINNVFWSLKISEEQIVKNVLSSIIQIFWNSKQLKQTTSRSNPLKILSFHFFNKDYRQLRSSKVIGVYEKKHGTMTGWMHQNQWRR